jgi:hypothetical protein
MSFFNFIETFFFLSLGITFVLILLLVYHFKQRLSALENKCDTVFEIISNMVQELAAVRQMQANSMNFRPAFNIPDELRQSIIPSMTPNEVVNKIKVFEQDFEEESEVSEDSEEDEDSDAETDYDDMPELINGTFEIEEPSTVKIINVPITDTIETDVLESLDLDQDNLNSEENDRIEPIELQEQEEQIHVEKLEESEALENNVDSDESRSDSKEVYSKMSVSELKALVITKGLSSDPSKKKKNELIKMLETSEN